MLAYWNIHCEGVRSKLCGASKPPLSNRSPPCRLVLSVLLDSRKRRGGQMANRSIVTIAALVGIVAGLLWSTNSLKATQQATAPQAPSVCVLPGPTNRYSPGAAVIENGQTYRCVYVYGPQLIPGGVAWVKILPMTPQTNSGLIQEPAGR